MPRTTGPLPMFFENSESVYVSHYPVEQNSTYVKATLKLSTNFWAYFATDPTKSLTGNPNGNSWAALAVANQRFHIDLGSEHLIKRIYYVNYHEAGSYTNPGVKDFTLWGSNSPDAFAELTYAIDTDWSQIDEALQMEQHVSSDVDDNKYIVLTNIISYQYYAFKFINCWNPVDEYMGVRRIELQV